MGFLAVQGLVHKHVPYVGEAPLLDTVSYKGGFRVVCLICECIEKWALQMRFFPSKKSPLSHIRHSVLLSRFYGIIHTCLQFSKVADNDPSISLAFTSSPLAIPQSSAMHISASGKSTIFSIIDRYKQQSSKALSCSSSFLPLVFCFSVSLHSVVVFVVSIT